MDALGLVEVDASSADILGLLVGVPRVLKHVPDTTDRRLPATYSGIGARTTRSLSLT
jgi:hypothetical protein